jgi:peptide-methionine (S)-S-oxide reductase
MSHFIKLGLGGGCHWCTEAVFQQLDGVYHVRQGYIKSLPPHDGWSEAITLEYDSSIITLQKLMEVHLITHSSTSNHQRRNDYRSAFYYFTGAQKEQLERVLISLSRKRNKNYITQVLPFEEFKASRESIQNYYKTRPDAPFCQRYIAPKLESIKYLDQD